MLSWKSGSGHLAPMRSITLRTYCKVTRSPHFARNIFLSEIILVVESRSSLLQKSPFFWLQVAASGEGFRWCRHKYCSHTLVEGRLCVSKVFWHLIELILITVDCVFWVELFLIFPPRWDEHEVLSLASHGLAGNTTFYVWGEEVSLSL